MGFGFNLVFVFILLPLTYLLSYAWLITRHLIYGKIIAVICLGIIGLVALSATIQALDAKKRLTKSDYYGQYVIDRSYFSGKQAN